MRARTKAITLTVILLLLIVILAVVIALRATLEASAIPTTTATEPAGAQPVTLDVIIPIPPEIKATGLARPTARTQEAHHNADKGEPTTEPTAEPEPAPVRNERYAAIEISEEEIEELAQVTFAESSNQCAEGQQAVVEVVLNRVLHDAFPDTVHGVLHQGEHTTVPQFSTVYSIGHVEPNAMQYAAIEAALYGTPILDTDVVFFSTGGENDRVWGKIGDHVFCREYIWG